MKKFTIFLLLATINNPLFSQIQNNATVFKECIFLINNSNGEVVSLHEQILRATFQRDSINTLLNEERETSHHIRIENERKIKELDDLISRSNYQISQLNAYIIELEGIKELHEKRNFAPFGIKQFTYKNTALGCTFLVSQIAVPIALGVGLEHAANRNYKLHQNRVALTREKHTAYYRKYKELHSAAIYVPLASAAGIYLINVLCNYYCTKIEITPQPIPASNGVTAGLSLNYKF